MTPADIPLINAAKLLRQRRRLICHDAVLGHDPINGVVAVIGVQHQAGAQSDRFANCDIAWSVDLPFRAMSASPK